MADQPSNSRTAARAPLDVGAMIKESGMAAAVIFALSFGLVGFKTDDVPGGIDIVFRFDEVLIATGLAFVGRLALTLIRQGRGLPVLMAAGPFAMAMLFLLLAEAPAEDSPSAYARFLPFTSTVVNWIICLAAAGMAGRAAWVHRHGVDSLTAEDGDGVMDRVAAKFQKWTTVLGPMLFLGALVLPFLPFVDRRLLDIGILVVTYIMLGWGLNIVVGLAGLLDLGYVAFYAVGAYSYALLAQYFDMGFWVCLPFAGIMAAFAGIILGFPVLRLRGDYLAIVTLGFGEMIRVILLNWYTFTNGPDGISGIPRPTFFGLPFKRSAPEGVETFHSFFDLAYAPIDRIIFLYYLILLMALATNFFTIRIRKLPVGRAWEALREDETACVSLGINPRNTKLTAFAIGAMFAGFGGSFFATRQGFISPESFTFIESAIILAIVVLGGMGSQLGVVLAAVLLIGLPEFFRELQQYRMLAFGGAMVMIMVWRPAGLLAHRVPTIWLSGSEQAKEPP